jgi:signal transduction histidine kinase
VLPADPAAAAAALDGALDRADQAIVEGRDAIGSLRSSRASDSELAQAIAALAEDFQRANAGRAPAFRATVEGTPRALHPVLREDVYRIACEALRNAYHHAHASRIEAEITYGVRDLRVRIRDDGRGIDPEYLKAPPARHWGLISMRERASQIGSDLRVWSGEGIGTEVELRIPGAIAYSGRGRPDLLRRLLGKGRHDAA